MPATINGKLDTIVGSNESEQGSITIALCNYGSQVPRVPDQNIVMLARVTAQEIEADDLGVVAAEVFGNDEIEPAGTYYTITVKDSNGDIVQVNAYVFLDGQEYDLGTTPPFDPTQTPGPLPPLIISQLLLIQPFTPTPNFPGDKYLTWAFTLSGDVTSSTLSGIQAGNLYTFIISQNTVGGWEFKWPPAVINPAPVSTERVAITIQTFVAIANNGPLLPIGPATYWPV
jgi:hypothetical protein